MRFKRILRALAFPHAAVLLVLLPVSAVCLVHSLAFEPPASAVAIVSYALAAYTLGVWCIRIPEIAALAALAYPVYNRVARVEREKIAPEIIRLTDELLK